MSNEMNTVPINMYVYTPILVDQCTSTVLIPICVLGIDDLLQFVICRNF